MSDVDFEELMSTDMSAVHRPPPLPVGTYRAYVDGKEFVKSQQGTNGVEYRLTKFEPREDVDKDALRAYLDDPGGDISTYERRERFWLTQKSLWRLKEGPRAFLTACGVDPVGPLPKLLEECVGQTVLCYIEQTVGKDGNAYNEITRFSEDA